MILRWLALLSLLFHSTYANELFAQRTAIHRKIQELKLAYPVSKTTSEQDATFMRRAANQALKAQGCTSPNPLVGCVIVDSGGHIVGEGYHARAGQPHAEVNALRMAGSQAKGATAYVTLEPCNHFGRTPPCTSALLAAGVKRVVSGTIDFDTRVSGAGLSKLRQNGIQAEVGVEETLCRSINSPYFFRSLFERSYVIAITHEKEEQEEEEGYYASSLRIPSFFSQLIDALLIHAPETNAIALDAQLFASIDVVQHEIVRLPDTMSVIVLCEDDLSMEHAISAANDMKNHINSRRIVLVIPQTSALKSKASATMTTTTTTTTMECAEVDSFSHNSLSSCFAKLGFNAVSVFPQYSKQFTQLEETSEHNHFQKIVQVMRSSTKSALLWTPDL